MAKASVRRRGRITSRREIRSRYQLPRKSASALTSLGDERSEVGAIPARRSILDLMALYTQEGEAPDIAAEREAFGDALYEAFRTGSRRP